MASRLTDIRSALSNPRVYNLLQIIMGAKRGRETFVNEFVRPPRGGRIIDVGCGTAQLLSFFPEDVSYIGYDPSNHYISHAKATHRDRGEFHLGYFDQKAAELHDPFDLVIVSGVLHHMSNDQVKELMALAYQSLVPGGRLVTVDPVLCTPQNPLARWLIKMDRGEYVRSDNEYMHLASAVFDDIDGTIRHTTWIPYSRWIMECRKPD